MVGRVGSYRGGSGPSRKGSGDVALRGYRPALQS